MSGDPTPAEAMRHLWCAVICAAIRDALAPDASASDRCWIGSRACREICELVDLDHRRLTLAVEERLALADAGDAVAATAGLYDMSARRRAAAARGEKLRARRLREAAT